MKRLCEVVASCFYIGHLPIVPATFGAAFGAVVYALVMPDRASVQLVVTIALIAVAVFTSGRAEERYGRDGRSIVVDEVAGMFVSLCFVPAQGFRSSATVIVGAFVLFRVFDIVKPFPAKSLQELRGGWGVVMDDVAAGVYANVCMRIALLVTGGG